MPALDCRPLTPARWADFERLFGPRGAYGGCWCMYWRVSRREFEAGQGEGNRCSLKALVDAGHMPGLLAYSGGEVVGWCAVAPREAFASLNRSPVLKRLDDTPVWALVCLYIGKDHRRQGVAHALIEAAADHVRGQGGRVLEAYPSRHRGRELAPVSAYMGTPEMFERAGFSVCAEPSRAKLVMRKEL